MVVAMESSMRMMSWSRYRLLARSLSRTARRCHDAKMRETRRRRRAMRRLAGTSSPPKRP
ncbi:hypothetical protein MA20_42275 [Bradyrhizobium japonicum]|uniref:Uncharacterized protein n=1 Tax=Bradyrhizobium japonicum TaxID=375 RepID=A0A0A3XHN9_BRAJP|nr:hypothetical protein MA20_42275 [Bradyrhizobium japonicum]